MWRNVNYLLWVISLLTLIGFSGCTDKYDFTVSNETDGIVIEAFISNKSFNNTRTYPSDGRRFSVKLTQTSDVTNIRGEDISGAEVVLSSDNGESWTYLEDEEEPGRYILYSSLFAAQEDVKYQLSITTPSGNEIESSWEKMPVKETEVGELSLEETTKDAYIYIGRGEKVLQSFEGISMSVKLPEHNNEEELYYRWNYDPIWVYVAPLAIIGSPGRTCWVTTPYYLRGYGLERASEGGYDKELFFLKTTGNVRVYEYFSLLITQSVVSEGYYYFWKDLQAQSEKGGLYDQPPFNLPTNFTSLNKKLTVNGYFGVVTENAKRWVFDEEELSYNIENNHKEVCENIETDPSDSCHNCRAFVPGNSVNYPPWWW